MKILLCHNYYQQRGGEDVVFEYDFKLLSSNSHEVRTYSVNNRSIKSTFDKIHSALPFFGPKKYIIDLINICRDFGPDVVHIHNFFPLLSPSAIEYLIRLGIPVVQTLHNYRMICANGLLTRNGNPCEACVGQSRWPGILYRCYRSSTLGSAVVARMGRNFRQICDQNRNSVTLVALTEFAKSRYVTDGFSADQIVVRGNTVSDLGSGPFIRQRKIVYVGRLNREKGVDLLVDIARLIEGEIEIIGDGPEFDSLKNLAPSNVIFCGRLEPAAVLEKIKVAAAVAVPSRWYEGFPMAVLEAMSTSTPLIASQIGSLTEIISHEKNGLLVQLEDKAAWVSAIHRILDNPGEARKMGKEARNTYIHNYSEIPGINSLIKIYCDALSRFRGTTQKFL